MRSTLYAQNSIDYMVLHNQEAVRDLIYQQGYEPPTAAKNLVQTTKELIRVKGKEVIEKLLELHPDKKAILSLNHTSKEKVQCHACSEDAYNTQENYCGNCGHSNYKGSGSEDSFLGQFENVTDQQLERYYKTAVKKSNTHPEHKNLASEVQLIWNELRQRKVNKTQPAIAATPVPVLNGYDQDRLVLMGLVFAAGILVGSSFKKTA